MRFFKLIGIFLFILPISYIIANILWFQLVDGKLYYESDPLLPLTAFLPPYIHNCCGDYYSSGWNQESVAQMGYLFIAGIILLSVAMSLLLYQPITKFLRRLEKDILKAV